jgi:hypothetical protein
MTRRGGVEQGAAVEAGWLNGSQAVPRATPGSARPPAPASARARDLQRVPVVAPSRSRSSGWTWRRPRGPARRATERRDGHAGVVERPADHETEIVGGARGRVGVDVGAGWSARIARRTPSRSAASAAADAGANAGTEATSWSCTSSTVLDAEVGPERQRQLGGDDPVGARRPGEVTFWLSAETRPRGWSWCPPSRRTPRPAARGRRAPPRRQVGVDGDDRPRAVESRRASAASGTSAGVGAEQDQAADAPAGGRVQDPRGGQTALAGVRPAARAPRTLPRRSTGSTVAAGARQDRGQACVVHSWARPGWPGRRRRRPARGRAARPPRRRPAWIARHRPAGPARSARSATRTASARWPSAELEERVRRFSAASRTRR